MAADNTWKTIAEVYRNREHKLIKFIQKVMKSVATPEQKVKLIDLYTKAHLEGTGRDPEKDVEVPDIISPVQDARKELLALLGPSQEEVATHLTPLSGLQRVRKQRSDKGKKRGPRKPKGDT